MAMHMQSSYISGQNNSTHNGQQVYDYTGAYKDDFYNQDDEYYEYEEGEIKAGGYENYSEPPVPGDSTTVVDTTYQSESVNSRERERERER